MVRFPHERVLLIGDTDRAVQRALAQAAPGARIDAVDGIFDAIAELSGGEYSTVLAAAEPIERRPEAAVRALRDLLGNGRLVLFGHPTLEPLSRKMLAFGCDDYVVSPPAPAELQQMFGMPPLRLVETDSEPSHAPAAEPEAPEAYPASPLHLLPLAEIMLDALLQHPSAAPAAAVARINEQIAPDQKLHLAAEPPAVGPDRQVLSLPVRAQNEVVSTLHLELPRGQEESVARHFLAQLAGLMSRLNGLQDRHNRLQKLAITDDLTGLYNGRYFRHFLTRILEKARAMRFPVTLLLFDIDNFKKYNDRFGHAVGDEILRQTATLLKKSCRDHDLVARISGDEFAVVFWEKEGPRQPREPNRTGGVSRVPQNIRPILDRFRRTLHSQELACLGPSGKGQLTISGGLAVYPYDANNVNDLIQAADHALMFGAKQSGKNSIFLVGGEEHPEAAEPET